MNASIMAAARALIGFDESVEAGHAGLAPGPRPSRRRATATTGTVPSRLLAQPAQKVSGLVDGQLQIHQHQDRSGSARVDPQDDTNTNDGGAVANSRIRNE